MGTWVLINGTWYKAILSNWRLQLFWSVSGGELGKNIKDAATRSRSDFLHGLSSVTQGTYPAVDGTANYAINYQIVVREPASQNGWVKPSVYFASACSGYFVVYSRNNDGTLKIEAKEAAARSFSAGANTPSDVYLRIKRGQFLGVYSLTANGVRNASGGVKTWYYNGAPGAVGTSYAMTSDNVNTACLSYAITPIADGETQRAQAAEGAPPYSGTAVTQGNAAVGATASLAANLTAFTEEVIAAHGVINQITIQAAKADTSAQIVIATRDGANNYLLVRAVPVVLAIGSNALTGLGLRVQPGQFLGLYSAQNGVLKYDTTGGAGIRYTTGIPSAAGTASTAVANWKLSISWVVEPGTGVIADAVAAYASELLSGSSVSYGQTAANTNGGTGLTLFTKEIIAKTGVITQVAFDAGAVGTFRIVIASRDASANYTTVTTFPVQAETVGVNAITGLAIPVVAGQRIGIYSNAAATRYLNGAAIGMEYCTGYSLSGASSTNFGAALSLSWTISAGANARISSIEGRVSTNETGLIGAVKGRRKTVEYLSTALTSAQVMAIGNDGQSNSISFYAGGEDGTPITTAQLFSNVMDGGSGAFVPLVSVTTEKSHVTSANFATAMMVKKGGYTPANQWLTSFTAGVGGTSITGLGPGSASATSYIAQATTLKNEATAAGKTFAFLAMNWIHGETDIANNMTQATYQPLLEALRASFQTSLRSLTGNTDPLYCIMMQPSASLRVVGGGPGPVLAQLDLAMNNPNYFLCGAPMYRMPHAADALHLSRVGFKLQGAYFGKSNAALLRGEKPQWIKPLSATYSGSTVTVAFDVPVAPLRFNVTDLGHTINQGFRVVDDSGDLPVRSIYISNQDEVVIVGTRALSGTVKVRYALDYLGTGRNITNGASGTLCDSDDTSIDIIGATYQLFNCAPHFELTAVNVGV